MIGWAVAAAAGAYGLAMLAAYGLQDSFLYPVRRDAHIPVVDGAQLLQLQSGSDRSVYALWVPPPDTRPVVVHFHGNGETLGSAAWLARRIRDAGLGAYLVEYPGYGLAQGTQPSRKAILADATVALDHLQQELNVPNARIVIQGQSLGSGVASEMAARGYGTRLILISPFTSTADVAAQLMPFLPARWLHVDGYDTEVLAPGIHLPVLIVHGTQDRLIPSRMSERLVEAFPNARLDLIDGAGHNDLFEQGGSQLWTHLVRFAATPASP